MSSAPVDPSSGNVQSGPYQGANVTAFSGGANDGIHVDGDGTIWRHNVQIGSLRPATPLPPPITYSERDGMHPLLVALILIVAIGIPVISWINLFGDPYSGWRLYLRTIFG